MVYNKTIQSMDTGLHYNQPMKAVECNNNKKRPHDITIHTKIITPLTDGILITQYYLFQICYSSKTIQHYKNTLYMHRHTVVT